MGFFDHRWRRPNGHSARLTAPEQANPSDGTVGTAQNPQNHEHSLHQFGRSWALTDRQQEENQPNEEIWLAESDPQMNGETPR